MAEHYLKLIRPILQCLGGEDQQKLDVFHLSIFRSLHLCKINYPFLHTVEQFYDPKTHVFRFNNFKICPLPEEYEAILGYPDDSNKQVAVPLFNQPDERNIQNQMARLFNLPSSSSLSYMIGNNLIIESFLKDAVAVNNKEVYWPRMIALCLYAQFLLVSPSGDGNTKLFQIIDQEKSGFNPMLVILVETLISLDNLTVTYRITGSPMLLEVFFLYIFLFSYFFYHFF